MRFEKKRPSGSGPRGWVVTLDELARWCKAYALTFPDDLDTQRNAGTDGFEGTNGINN